MSEMFPQNNETYLTETEESSKHIRKTFYFVLEALYKPEASNNPLVSNPHPPHA